MLLFSWFSAPLRTINIVQSCDEREKERERGCDMHAGMASQLYANHGIIPTENTTDYNYKTFH